VSNHTPGPWSGGRRGCARVDTMTNTEHQALVALRTIEYGTETEHGRTLAREAIPKLEALIAERDGLRAALEGFVDLVSQDGHGFHDGTDMGRALKRARAALAKAKGKP